jgi:ArsR family transcriptional regulator, virulence genes transcriptional regulator
VARLGAAEITELYARVCKALADPKRLLVIYELRYGPRVVGELASSLGMSQPNTSRHLAVLRDRGFVTTERAGITVEYSLASLKPVQALDLLREFMAEELSPLPGRPARAAGSRADAAEINELHARVCKAIADGKRLLIINELRDGPRTVGELADVLGAAQANVSQHLAILRDRGIVIARRSGSNIHYSLASRKVVDAVDLLYQFMAERRTAGAIPLAG